MKTQKTSVIFRKFKDGEIIALFPYEFWHDFYVSSYMHVGQHSGADYYGILKDTKLATETEYKPLFNELANIGYDLEIIKRVSRKKIEIKKRLEHFRTELRNERISYGELIELSSLSEYIYKSDVELLEAAGVHESE